MPLIMSLIARFKEHRLIELAAQCSYYLLLSLFPFLIFIITLISFFPISLEFDIALIQDIVPGDIAGMIENQWSHITAQQSTSLLSFGIIFTLWTASQSLNTMLRLLNRAYDVTEDRKMIKARLLSITLTIGMFAVVLVALGLQVVGAAFMDMFVFDLILFEFNAIRWVLSSLLLFIVFTLLYWLGPNIRLRFSEIYYGAIFATVGWQVTSFFFSYYLNNFANYTATYGTIGAVIALMVWFHLSSVIILFGGEINAALKEDKFDKVEWR
ncbi:MULTISPECIES: YihY/virulence factor BrkB family protein [Bacillaceae]|uniref:YihY/virulence factor BrkB family protein n=1 Tax=Evansella alkalicola TaxID=745819 RepID=A0ABS6JQX0_9BACI|nr:MULTISPECIES: YihY/virulence factor BrkB family protein [Bacillaceae]MBU9720953.1 YihY/virulence factor BrkB family protein [Bacillus alkalicola]